MGLVYDKVIKRVILESLQMQRHALHTAADHMGLRLLHALHEAPRRRLRPQRPEGLRRLVYQLLGVGQKEGPASAALCVQDRCYCFACARGVAEQGDGFPALPHGPQSLQRLPLVLFQLQGAAVQCSAPLGRQIVLDLPQPGPVPQKDPELVLHQLRLELHLPHRPPVHIPAQIDHAVLLEQVVIELAGRNKALVVGRLVIDLYGHPAAIALQSKVRIAAVLVNVVEMVLGVEIPGLFRAERLAEQLDEQVLRNTAGGRVPDSHGRSLISL